MHRDPGVQHRRLDVKRNEKADCDPGGQDRGQGHLHREFAVSPTQGLDLDPHPMLLDLLSETTAYRPPAIDRASSQGRGMRSLWLPKPIPNSTLSFSCIAPGIEVRERNISLSRKAAPGQFPGRAFLRRSRQLPGASVPSQRQIGAIRGPRSHGAKRGALHSSLLLPPRCPVVERRGLL